MKSYAFEVKYRCRAIWTCFGALHLLINSVDLLKNAFKGTLMQINEKLEIFGFFLAFRPCGSMYIIFVCTGEFPMLLRTKETLPKFFQNFGS